MINAVPDAFQQHFYPRPPGGGRRTRMIQIIKQIHFYPRPPGGGRPSASQRRYLSPPISIHALRVEGDPKRSESSMTSKRFLSTPSGWRATAQRDESCHCAIYFYPRPPGGGRPLGQTASAAYRAAFLSTPSGWRATTTTFDALTQELISIHALRVEGDLYNINVKRTRTQNISIHALRVEGDRPPSRSLPLRLPFLSTPSGWRATVKREYLTNAVNDFYPRPPGGGRLVPLGRCHAYHWISIHALRVEGDNITSLLFLFQIISIHALRVEGDGEGWDDKFSDVRFLSTPSGWRATAIWLKRGQPFAQFLSTPSGWRATQAPSFPRMLSSHFYPRPPGGGRLGDFFNVSVTTFIISIHALRVEGDKSNGYLYVDLYISIHALRVEGDSVTGCLSRRRSKYFYPRPPGGGRPVIIEKLVTAIVFLSTPSGWRATEFASPI